MRRDDEVYMCNDVGTWETWDHYSIFARIQEEEQTDSFRKGKRKKKWTGWKPKTDEQQIEFRKKVMEDGDDKIDEDLATIQKTLETAAGKVAHITLKPKEKNSSKYAGEYQIT